MIRIFWASVNITVMTMIALEDMAIRESNLSSNLFRREGTTFEFNSKLSNTLRRFLNRSYENVLTFERNAWKLWLDAYYIFQESVEFCINTLLMHVLIACIVN